MVKAFNKDSKNQTNKSFKSKSIKDRKSADGIKYMTFYNAQFTTEFFRITFIKRERKSRPYITRINTGT